MKKMNKKGFTLIELLAVIVILAIIMVIAVPQILEVIDSSRRSAWANNIKMISKAIETNDSAVTVSGTGTKVAEASTSAGQGCEKTHIEKVADIDTSSTKITVTTNGDTCVFTAEPTGQFSSSKNNQTSTITCSSANGCSYTDPNKAAE